MGLLVQTKIPQRIAKPQQLGSLGRIISRGREKVLKNLKMRDLGRSLLGEFSAIRRRRETRESVLHVNRAKEGSKEFASDDPRARQLGRTLSDEFAVIKEKYRAPDNPIVLCHGLLGFDELRLAGNYLPVIRYWRGVTEAFNANNIEVILTSVPASGSIEVRAKALAECIRLRAKGRNVNMIGCDLLSSGEKLS
ncbi:hypothetical protein HOY82DRAFT_476642 [Tuber indicum]|nr:hypothetical protein HOY82DRAFT_476642 [Tuber indicum]